jgi:serine/threonine protein kinase/tetratricopeptide (TPR) repeat protein
MESPAAMNHDESMAADDLDVGFNVVLDSFESEWRSGRAPSIKQFSSQVGPRASAGNRRRMLIELVAVDLWHRWERGAESPDSAADDGLPPQPRLEDYIRQTPELGPLEQLPALLVREEFRVRLLHGDAATVAEYRRRFPDRPDLYAELAIIQRETPTELPSSLNDAEPSTNRAQSLVRTATCPNCRSPLGSSTEIHDGPVSCPSCGTSVPATDTQRAPLPTPRRINQFELAERLGGGGFGDVWKARDTKLHRDVAIKIPRSAGLDSSETALFLHEAQSAAQLRHPNIVPVYEAGLFEGAPYIVSAFVQGLPLSERLQDYTPRAAAELCAQIAEALDHAHEAGVVHRDLKPANVMIDPAGRPHVLDFGVSRRVGADVTLSDRGQILGTPAYMSPEQASGNSQSADRRTDVYALGVILFQLLTGELPFRGNANIMMMQIIQYDAPSPRELVGGLPRDLETICLKCLEKKPGSRFATASALADDLRRFLRGAPITARPISRWERAWKLCRANPLAASLVAAIIAFLGILSAVLAMWNVESARNVASARASYGLAVETLHDVVFNLQTTIEQIPGATRARAEMLNRALATMERLAATDDRFERDDATALAARLNLGHLILTLGDAPRALQEFREAVALGERLAARDPDNLGVKRDLGVAYGLLAEGLEQSGDAINALSAYKQARQTLEPLLGVFNPPPTTALCRIHNRTAELCLEVGDVRAANVAIDKAFEIYRQYQLQLDPEFARDRWESLVYRGDVCIVQQRLDAAEADYRAALDMARVAAGGPLDALSHDDVATSDERLATLLQERLEPSDVEEADQLYRSALEIRERLVAQDPQNVGAQQRLATLHDRMGAMWLRLLRPSDAVPRFETARTIRAELLASAPGSDRIAVEQLSSFGYLARAAEAQHRFTEAMAWCDKGAALWQRLDVGGQLTSQPRMVELNDELSAIRERSERKQRAAAGDESLATSDSPLAIELRTSRAISLGAAGKWREAELTVKRLADDAANDAQVLDLAARTCAELGRLEASGDASAIRFDDGAIDYLTRAYQAGAYGDSSALAYLSYCEAFDHLRKRDDFQQIVRRVSDQLEPGSSTASFNSSQELNP